MSYYSYKAVVATLSTVMFLTGLVLSASGLLSNNSFVVVTVLSVLFTIVLTFFRKQE